jgi:hypothetical protein
MKSAACFLAAIVFLTLPAKIDAQPLSCAETKRITQDGVDWLLKGQREDGLYAYTRDPMASKDSDAENIVRQIGTLWAVTRSLEVEDRPETRASINRFRAAIPDYLKTGKAAGKEIAYVEEKGVAKLNAAALYLLALLEMKDKGFSLTEEEQAAIPLLARGLMGMREENGGFRYLYYVSKESNRITPYGSSEALLALARLAHEDGDASLKAYANESFGLYYKTYLASVDFNSTNLKGYFSWALHAQGLLQEDGEKAYNGPVRTMLTKAFKHRRGNPECKDRGCIVTFTLSDMPYLEGVMSALPLARRYEQDKRFLAEMENYASLALQRIAYLQVNEKNHPELLKTSSRPATDLLGGFCEDNTCRLMRNDLAQHALTALINYYGQECAA